MPNRQSRPGIVSIMRPPYRHLRPVDHTRPVQPRGGGWVMVWNLGANGWPSGSDVVTGRHAGVALAIVLPDGNGLAIAQVLRAIERSRPQAVLPHHHAAPRPADVASVIRRPPASLSTSVSEYLEWRGFALDPVTRNVVRRTVELSAHVQTITALAKNLYMSRRALGRRFTASGLPVPSHWLHASRILRASIKLQNSDASLFSIAVSLGYPDGFSLSNQMSRLCGIRPLDTRTQLGWEWVMECWLAREAEKGNVSRKLLHARPSVAPPPLGDAVDDSPRPKAAISR